MSEKKCLGLEHVQSDDEDIADDSDSANEGDEDTKEEEGDDQEEVDEEEEEDDDDAGLNNKPNIKSSKKLQIPVLLLIDTNIIDCPYFLACHYLSSALLHYQFKGFLTPDEIESEAIKTIAATDFKCPFIDNINEGTLKLHVQTILKVDPEMYCWRNFHMCYLFGWWTARGKNQVAGFDPYQRKTRRYVWYYIIIYLRKRMSQHAKVLNSSYLKSITVEHALKNTKEVKNYVAKMVKQKLS